MSLNLKLYISWISQVITKKAQLTGFQCQNPSGFVEKGWLLIAVLNDIWALYLGHLDF